MKKYFSFFIIIAYFCLNIASTSAQLLEGSAVESMKKNSEDVRVFSGFSQNASVGSIAAAVIMAVLGLLGIIFFVLMVLSGFRWMTAAGNDDQVKKAQETIKAAIIGLIIVLAAYAITYYIFTYLPFSGGQVIQRGDGGTLVN